MDGYDLDFRYELTQAGVEALLSIYDIGMAWELYLICCKVAYYANVH